MSEQKSCIFSCLALGILLLSLPAEAAKPNPGKALTGLDSAQVENRRVAINEFMESLGKRDAEEFTNDLLPVLVKGMSDSDSEVRRISYGCINMLANAIRLTRVGNGAPVYGVKVSIEFEKEPRLKELLEKGLNDPSQDIRGYSIVGLAAGYQPSPEMETRLNRMLGTEKTKRGREMIVGGLSAWHYSSTTTLKNLRGALDDEDSNIRAHATRYLSDIKDDDALRIIVRRIGTSKGPAKIQLLNSVGKYGKKAKAHLNELRKAEREEKDPTVKEASGLAIKRIEADTK